MRTRLFFSLGAICFMSIGSVFCQDIIGPSNVNVNSTISYTYDRGAVLMVVDWIVVKGSIQSTSVSGTEYTVVVKWDQGSGNGSIDLTFFGMTSQYPNTKNIIIGDIPATPPTPTIASGNGCGAYEIKYEGSPPSGIVWYWQGTNPNGTSMSNSSNPNDNLVIADGTYYLRAYKNGVWSTSSSSISLNVDPLPEPPAKPEIHINDCSGNAVLKWGSSKPSNETWRWYKSGSSTSLGTGSQLTVTSNGNYYIISTNQYDCTRSSQELSFSLNLEPPTPSTITVSSNNCSNKTLTRGTPPNGVTWFWQGLNADGYFEGNSDVSLTASSSGTYYLRAKSIQGCWSANSRSIEVTVNDIPDAPSASFEFQDNCDGSMITRTNNPPTDVRWYWQTSGSGFTMTHGYSTTKNFTGNGIKQMWLRAYNTQGGCWSSSTQSVSYTATEYIEIANYTVSGNPTHCVNSSGSTMTIEGSQVGVIYAWRKPGIPLSAISKDGTGAPIQFENLDLEGSWELVAAKGTCESIMTTVTFNKASLPNVDAGNTVSAFTGNNVNLNSGATPSGGIWSWSGGSGNTFNASQTGNFSVNYTYTDGNGCSNSDSKLISILNDPEIDFTTNNSVLPVGGSVEVSATATYQSYQWYKNNNIISGATSSNYSITEPGIYHVKVSTADSYEKESSEIEINYTLASDDMNYRQEWTPKSPVTDVNNIGLTVSETNRTVSYFDGLGRAIQEVQVNGSPLMNDMVQPIEYDELGRMTISYLPYAGGTGGLYNPNGVTDQSLFYAQSSDHVSDSKPYSETIFENSPLNRTSQQFGPGAEWHNNNKSIDYVYQINTASDEVMLFSLNGAQLEYSVDYGANLLSKNVVSDEQGYQTVEFINRQGQTILKKVQANVAASEWADTYYVYDDWGNLVFVLPPELSKELSVLAGPINIDQSLLDRWAFQYKYDHRDRMIEKKVAGADWVYMVYDDRDRLVLTQDGNQKINKEWLFTKYDALNRPVTTGIYEHGSILSQAQMQELVNNFYENVSVLSDYEWYETVGTDILGYTDKSFPKAVPSNNYLSVTYYDDYNFLNWNDQNYDFNNPDERTTLETNGTNQYIALHQSYDEANSIPQMTVEAWMKTDFVGGQWDNWAIIDFDRSEYFNLYVRGDNGQVGFSTNASGDAIDDTYSNIAVNDGEWHHIVAVYDGVNKHIYVDGILDKSTTNPHQGLALGTGITRFGIIGDGSEATTFNGNRNGLYFKGKIGEVRLWNAVRTSSEIHDFRDIPLSGNEAGLVGMWTMDERSGNTLNDQTGNGNDGELQNMDNTSWGNELKANGLPLEKFDHLKGQITGTMVHNLASNQWIKSVNYYDDKYRLIQSVSNNHLNGKDVLSTYYDFTNKILKTVTQHNNQESSKLITRFFEYDHAGRLLKTYHQVNSDPSILLSHNHYNELGELIEKNLHSEDQGSSFAQSIDYRYNIRGWLTRINDANLSEGDGDYFGMEIGYNNDLGIGNTPRYNGDVSGIKWSTDLGLADIDQRANTYEYDVMSRLKSANHQYKLGAWQPSVAHSVSNISYNLNGSPTEIIRKDMLGNDLDVLSYIYEGNQPVNITDGGDNDYGFKDGNKHATTGIDDYRFDENGNLEKDENKDIIRYSYNYLNLPDTIELTGDRMIRFIYDAAGTKLAQENYENGQLVKRRDYVGEFFYENDTLRSISHDEGRIVMDFDGQPVYNYTISDNLQNGWLSFTTQPHNWKFDATLETESSGDEEDVYSNVAETRVTFPSANHTPGGDEAAELDAAQPVGPAISLHVFPGDTLSMEVYAYYEGGNGYSGTSSLAAFIAAVAGGFGGYNGSAEAASQATYNAFDNTLGALGFSGTEDDNVPAAYLNYILFDKFMAYKKSGFIQISQDANMNHERLAFDDMVIDQEGLLYVYTSYESANGRAFFDDMKVTHAEGPIVSTNTYYPNGGQMQALSFQRPSFPLNRFKFIDRELIDDYGIEIYDHLARTYDPWWGVGYMQIDPLADQFSSWTSYHYAFSNPMRYLDKTGMAPEDGTECPDGDCDDKKDKNPSKEELEQALAKAKENGDLITIYSAQDGTANDDVISNAKAALFGAKKTNAPSPGEQLLDYLSKGVATKNVLYETSTTDFQYRGNNFKLSKGIDKVGRAGDLITVGMELLDGNYDMATLKALKAAGGSYTTAFELTQFVGETQLPAVTKQHADLAMKYYRMGVAAKSETLKQKYFKMAQQFQNQALKTQSHLKRK